MMKINVANLVGGSYKDFWQTEKRYCVCKGSRGSKKSKTTALRRVFRLLKYPESNYLCLRRYSTNIKDSIFADTLWALNAFGMVANVHYKAITSPYEITLLATGQKILFKGLDDGLKITSTTVAKGVLNFVDIEEAYEISEAQFNKVDMSIRGKLPEGYFKQLTLIFNPWSANSWLKPRFFDTPKSNIFNKTTTYMNNEFLDDADIAVFEDMKEHNPRRYDIEGLGNWGIAEGLIYENFEVQAFNTEEIRLKEGIKSGCGLDFGYTDPNAFLDMLVDNKEKKIYICKEWYKNGVTNQQIAAALLQLGYGTRTIICDSAEPKSIAELNSAGLRAEGSRKGRDSRNHGIQQIQNYKIIIHPECKEFYREIQNYCWLRDKNGKPTDTPDHEFSHAMDAMRYGVAHLLLDNIYSWD